MITSRNSGRWIIPKGWPMKGRKDHAAAAQEAFEEASVTGKVNKRPLGAYTYDKRADGGGGPVRVMVYLLEVVEEKRAWPEKDQRRREWMDPQDAAALVASPALSTFCSGLAKSLDRNSRSALRQSSSFSRLFAVAGSSRSRKQKARIRTRVEERTPAAKAKVHFCAGNRPNLGEWKGLWQVALAPFERLSRGVR